MPAGRKRCAAPKSEAHNAREEARGGVGKGEGRKKAHLACMNAARSVSPAAAPGLGGPAPSHTELTQALPPSALNRATTAGVQARTSSVRLRTLLMCVPSCLCRPEQRRHRSTPRLMDAQSGLRLAQSAQVSFPGSGESSSKGLETTEAPCSGPARCGGVEGRGSSSRAASAVIGGS